MISFCEKNYLPPKTHDAPKTLSTEKKLLRPAITNILLVEDDVDEQYFFKIAIESISDITTVTVVSDGVELIEYLSINSNRLPEIIFLDIIMPRKNGIECLKEIKLNEQLHEIPVVMYSNSTEENYVSKCYEYGASFFLEKGNYAQLTENITKLLSVLRYPNRTRTREQFKFNV
jgi:CheY-like chemotaxis protein